MKVIFLDIDGVLITTRNGHASFSASGDASENRSLFDEDAVNNLNKLLEETGAKIVISSSLKNSRSKSELSLIFKLAGIKKPSIIGVTPFIWDNELKRTHRGKEILEWLSDHPVVEKYIVIDDCGYEYLTGIPEDRYVQTTMSSGFGSEEAYKSALKALTE